MSMPLLTNCVVVTDCKNPAGTRCKNQPEQNSYFCLSHNADIRMGKALFVTDVRGMPFVIGRKFEALVVQNKSAVVHHHIPHNHKEEARKFEVMNKVESEVKVEPKKIEPVIEQPKAAEIAENRIIDHTVEKVIGKNIEAATDNIEKENTNVVKKESKKVDADAANKSYINIKKIKDELNGMGIDDLKSLAKLYPSIKGKMSKKVLIHKLAKLMMEETKNDEIG